MLQTWVKSRLRARARESSWERELYRRICRPDGREWARVLRESALFHRMGEHCSILTNVTISDPSLVSMGDNVRMSGCTLFGHDGSVNMINRAFGLKLDSVGSIEIGSHVFIGHGAIVLPGVRIGDRVIVAAGAVVSRDIPSDCIAAGVPAKPVRSLEEYVDLLKARHARYPWRALVEARDAEIDPALEPELRRMRAAYFFGDAPDDQSAR